MGSYSWVHCPKCDGEVEFEIEPPDYEVGLMGYSVGMFDKDDRTCQCDFTEDEVEDLERRMVEKLYDYEPPGID